LIWQGHAKLPHGHLPGMIALRDDVRVGDDEAVLRDERRAAAALHVGAELDRRVQDAIEAAGGLTDAADRSRVNLAAVLHDGDLVHVPQTNAAEPAAPPTRPGGEVVYINTASTAELETLPGIGPGLAARIIAYREENGRFRGMEDLDQVSGIGPSTLADLEGLISFE